MADKKERAGFRRHSGSGDMALGQSAVRVDDVAVRADDAAAILAAQKAAILKHGPLSIREREEWLDRLIGLMVDFKSEIADAVNQDFGRRSREATLMADVFAVLSSLKLARASLEEWAKPVRYEGMFPDTSAQVEYHPLGVVGVMSPWNFPFNLTFAPLAGIVAAGNRAMIRPSELSPASSALMARMIETAFAPTEIAVVNGGPEVAQAFASLPFDHLLFTGGGAVARRVMRAAAENLTPVTLELGGKCPVVVSPSAAVDDAAARVLTIKTLNAGQICLAPDYVLVPESRANEFVAAARKAVAAMYPTLANNPDYTSIINQRQFDRLQALLADARAKGAEIVELNPAGESFPRESHRIPPTLVLNPSPNMDIMQEEVFGPLLPVKTYSAIDQAIAHVNSGDSPLALYYFGTDPEEERKVLDQTRSGGVTINDVMTHAFAENLPFGGVGASGMGSYHGKAGFINFSHARSIYRQGKAIEAEYMIRAPFGEPIRQFLDSVIVK
jgi:coniferyl-aldehyde dehydrogenase